MDPDYYSRKMKTFSFIKLYSKIALLGIALLFSSVTIIFAIEWTSGNNSEENPPPRTPGNLGEVLAVTDSETAGGVTFSIPTNFTAATLFESDVTIEQNTNLNGDLYYRGELVDLGLISEGLQIDTELLTSVLIGGPGITIEGDDTLEISNTGVLSVNGETGDLTIPIVNLEEINELLGDQSIFKNILVPDGPIITASSNNDSLTFIPGTGISLSSNPITKSITISSNVGTGMISHIVGTDKQIYAERVGSVYSLSLPQNIDTGAIVKFSQILLENPTDSLQSLSLNSNGRIEALNDTDLYVGGTSTGSVILTSKGTQSLLIDGADLTANGSLKGVTDFSASGEIELTSLGNGIVQALGYKLTSGPIDLSSSNHVSGILSSSYGGTGTDKIPTDGQILIGSGLTGEYEPRSLSTGNGLSITRAPYSLTITNTGVTKIAGGVRHILVNGSYSPTGLTGDILLTLPQILDTVASPTFESLKLASSENMLTFSSGSENVAYLTLEELNGNRSYQFPDASGTICLTTGNCATAGGGLIGLGTANFIPKYDTPGILTPSLIYDNGTSVGVGTSSPLADVVLDVHGAIRIGEGEGSGDILNTTASTTGPGSSLYWGNRIICDSSGNCIGEDGGVISNGTDNYLPIFGSNGQSLNNSLIYDSGSAIGIGTTSPSGFISISGDTGSSALSINQTDSLKNILTASASGQSRMVLTGAGNLNLASGVYQNQGLSGVSVEGYSCVTTSGGIVTGSGSCPVDPSASLWDSQSTLLFAKDTTQNLAIGGSTVNNAKFTITNINSGDPTIWLRQSPTRTLSLTSSGTIRTVNDDSITLDSGENIVLDADEDIVLSPGSGQIITSGKFISLNNEDISFEAASSLLVKAGGYNMMQVSGGGVGINTSSLKGILTVKESSSYPTSSDPGGGGPPDDNLISNPADSDFSSNTGNWDLGSGLSIADGLHFSTGTSAVATLDNQYMGNYIQGGIAYTVTFEVVSLEYRGSINIQLGPNASRIISLDDRVDTPGTYGTLNFFGNPMPITPSGAASLSLGISSLAGGQFKVEITNVRVTSTSITPEPPPPPPPTPSNAGFVLESSDGGASPFEMRAGGSGLFNTFVGYSVGSLNESGINNAGFGANALLSGSTAASNSAFGANALASNVDGDSNVAVGYNAGYHLAGGSGNIFIGPNAGASSSATFSDQLYIANTAGSPLIWGDFSEKMVGINLSTPTSANNTLSIAGSLCVTETGICALNATGTIYTENTVVTGADLAENYVSSQALQPGDVVSMADNGNSQAIVKARDGSSTLLGVISTKPGVTLNSEAETDSIHKYIYPVALSGRVPTKVSTANGEIKTGDPLTIGETPGVAVKATSSTYIVGRALEGYSESEIGTITIFANAGWYSTLKIDQAGNLIPNNNTHLAGNNTPILPLTKLGNAFEDLETKTINSTTGIESRVTLIEEKLNKLEDQNEILNQILDSEFEIASDSSQIFTKIKGLQLDTITLTESLQIGSIIINAAENSINTIDKPLQLQSESQENVEFFKGAITLNENGDIVTKGTLKAQKIEIETTDEENASLGVGKIPEGESAAIINTKAVTEKSNIFITPKTLYEGVLAVTEQKDQEYFKVEVEKAGEEEIFFNWWIIN